MQAIEFQTTLKKIISAMPKEKRDELGMHREDETVRVIVLTSSHQHPRVKHAIMNKSEIRELIHRFYARYAVHSIAEPIQLNASQLREMYSLSHWDSLIVSVALHSGATQMYSEDMQNGLVINDQLTVVNPFAFRN